MDPDDDDFHTDMTSEVQEGELLDYVDNFEDTMTQVIDAGEKESDNIISEEVGRRHQETLDQNKEEREKMKLKLAPQKQLAEAKLREEEECVELAKMERKIKELNARRSGLKSELSYADHDHRNHPSRKRYDKHDKASRPGRQNNNNPVTQVGHRSQFREGTNADKQRGADLQKQAEKERMWLDSAEDTEYIHETRSEPGDSPLKNTNCMPCVHFRRGLRDQRKPTKDIDCSENVECRERR